MDADGDPAGYCMCCYTVTWVIWAYVIFKVADYLIRIPRMRNYKGRYIFVTGCDTGFGNEIAKRLDKLGCCVFAGCMTETGETSLRKECSDRLMTLHLDVTNSEHIKKAYEFVESKLPKGTGLWALMNNAGIGGRIGPSEWLQKEDYEQCFAVNLYGVIEVTTTLLPFIKRANGRVVSTASVFGRVSLTGSAPYCISKHGVEVFTDGIRRELIPWKCSAHLIEPGFHKTNIMSPEVLASSLQHVWQRLSPELKAEYGQEFYDKSCHFMINKFVQKVASERIGDVVDAYEHALIGMYPRARYVVGKDAKFLWLPLQWMPEWLGDWILYMAPREKLIPAACANNS